jgi:hypothetical protein
MFVYNVLATTVNAYLSEKKIIECLFLFNITKCDLEKKKKNSIALISIVFFSSKINVLTSI